MTAREATLEDFKYSQKCLHPITLPGQGLDVRKRDQGPAQSKKSPEASSLLVLRRGLQNEYKRKAKPDNKHQGIHFQLLILMLQA